MGTTSRLAYRAMVLLSVSSLYCQNLSSKQHHWALDSYYSYHLFHLKVFAKNYLSSLTVQIVPILKNVQLLQHVLAEAIDLETILLREKLPKF